MLIIFSSLLYEFSNENYANLLLGGEPSLPQGILRGADKCSSPPYSYIFDVKRALSGDLRHFRSNLSLI